MTDTLLSTISERSNIWLIQSKYHSWKKSVYNWFGTNQHFLKNKCLIQSKYHSWTNLVYINWFRANHHFCKNSFATDPEQSAISERSNIWQIQSIALFLQDTLSKWFRVKTAKHHFWRNPFYDWFRAWYHFWKKQNLTDSD